MAADVSDPFAGIALVVFDFDGVIADSEVISLSTLQTTLAEHGLELPMAQVQEAFLGRSLAAIEAHVAERSPASSAAGFAAAWQARLFQRFRDELRPVPGIGELLEHLNGRGIDACIASSGTRERIGFALRLIGLADRFKGVFSAEEVPRGKPAPDLFLHAAFQMKASPEACLVIEDAEPGVHAAKAAQMRCVGFCGGKHLRGQEKAHGARLLAAGADRIALTHKALAL